MKTMKKILSLVAAVMLCCTAHAAHMSLQAPRAEAPALVAAEMQADTMYFYPGAAYCRHLPQGDQQGMYYMLLSFLSSESETYPQMQLHILVQDTMTLSREDNKLIKAAFLQTESTGGNAIGAGVELNFLQYETADGFTSAKYDIVSRLVFEKHEPIVCKYRGFVTFISDATNTIYVPTHEGNGLAIEQNVLAPVATKVLRDGKLVILQGGREYSPLGQVLK